jgi:hypothetical protein
MMNFVINSVILSGTHERTRCLKTEKRIDSFRPMLPKPFSTATQFLERKSIATHTVSLDKKKVVLKKIYNIRRILCALFFTLF